MLEKPLLKQFLLFMIILIVPVVLTGVTFAGAADNDINADLIKSAFSGDLSEVERLLAAGANVNAKRDNGITALMGASIEGYQEVVAFLLAKGADVNAKVFFFGHSDGATACDLASQKDHQEIVKLLVRAGAFHEEKVEAVHVKKEAYPESNPSSKRRRD
jgi:ankyrin repeat protein